MTVERLARVELQEPYTHLILWSWHRLPFYLSPIDTFRSSARPNAIHEREIHGAKPHQLKAAFVHLSALAQQRERLLSAQAETLLRERDTIDEDLAQAGRDRDRLNANMVHLDSSELRSRSARAKGVVFAFLLFVVILSVVLHFCTGGCDHNVCNEVLRQTCHNETDA